MCELKSFKNKFKVTKTDQAFDFLIFSESIQTITGDDESVMTGLLLASLKMEFSFTNLPSIDLENKSFCTDRNVWLERRINRYFPKLH